MRYPEIKVLDHGHVRLVDHVGDDLSISRAARIDPDASWRDGGDARSDAWLIWRLWNRGRTRPLEAVKFRFEVKLPVFILLKWHSCQDWTVNSPPAQPDGPQDFYVPDPEVVMDQSTVGRRNTGKGWRPDLATARQVDRLQEHCSDALSLYRHVLHDGWSPALAQSILPTNAYTRAVVKVDLLNLLRFLSLRYDDQTSYEVRVTPKPCAT